MPALLYLWKTMPEIHHIIYSNQHWFFYNAFMLSFSLTRAVIRSALVSFHGCCHSLVHGLHDIWQQWGYSKKSVCSVLDEEGLFMAFRKVWISGTKCLWNQFSKFSWGICLCFLVVTMDRNTVCFHNYEHLLFFWLFQSLYISVHDFQMYFHNMWSWGIL
jgi:hypothetical protein